MTHEPHCPVPRAAARGESASCLCATQVTQLTETKVRVSQKELEAMLREKFGDRLPADSKLWMFTSFGEEWTIHLRAEKRS